MMRRLTSFGPPVLALDLMTVPLPAERRFQLLLFLAGRGQWVSRDQLTALFWADHPGVAARRNLRRLLFDLRQLPWLQEFESRGDSVRWSVDSDRQEFESLVAQRAWAAATALVRGPYLDGMENNATAAFGEWLNFERQWLHDHWRLAVERNLESLRADPAATIDAAQAALNLDPLNESVLTALLAAHEAQGRFDAAQRAYEGFRLRLLNEIGIEPSARLRGRMEAARARPAARRAVTAPPAEPPLQAGFIGRRLELRELTELLRRAECRRVNVLGPGGIGKSSLARAALPLRAPEFADGAYWIDLRAMTQMTQAAVRIADALGLELREGHDPWPQVLARLSDAHALLVLDNCEQVSRLGEACDELLGHCARIKLLLTSRQRLGGRTEWVFPLAGLPVPDKDETELAAVRAFDAVRLFEARAFAVAPSFELGAQALDVARLVREFEGMPLAIELAASCVRVMPVRAILDDLLKDVAQLDATAAGGTAAPGERGLHASFMQSWRLLSGVEQRVLARLSVHADSFERAAAEHIAQASLPVLAALIDKSLLRAADGERFSLHPLIRHFAQKQLDDAESVRARHAEYFARYLALQTQPGGRDRMRRIDLCLPDCIAAWHWACDARAADLIVQLATPLMKTFDETGRWSEGLDLFRGAATRFGSEGFPASLARADIVRCQAMLHYRRGEFDAAERLARESLRILATCRNLRGVDLCLNLIGGALRQRGQWNEARRFFDRALRRARADGNTAQALRIANNLATVEMATGHPDEAIARCESLLDEHGATEDKLGIAMTLIILGNAYSATRRREAAQRWYEQGLALAEQHRLVTVKPFFLQALGSCHREQGRPEVAREFYRRTLATSPEGLEPQIEIYASLGLARVEMRRDCDAAVPPLHRALAVAIRARSPAWQAAVIAGWGEWHAARGDRERAAILLSFAALSASIDANLAREAEQRLDELALSAPQITAARSMAAGMSVEEIVAGLPAAPAA